MNRLAFIRGAGVFGFLPAIACSLAAAQWGVMPAQCFVACIAMGGLAGVLLTPKRQVVAAYALLAAPLPATAPLLTGGDYHTHFCVFGRRDGVEL